MTFNLPESLEYNGVRVAIGAESADRQQNAVSYLMAYGFAKSLQDSVAGVKKLLSTEAHKLSDKDVSLAESYRADYPGASVDEIIRAEMAARAEAILAGTVGTRAARLSGPDAIRRVVIDEYFKAWAKSMADKGRALPTLKSRFGVTAKEATDEQRKAIAEAISALRTRYAELNAAKIEEETQRRIAAQAERVGDDIDMDLDAMLDDAAESADGEGDESGENDESDIDE